MNSNLLFTSCGDQTTCHELWTKSNRNYDIMAVYYGDDDVRFKTYCECFDYVFRHKGSKFQNFFSFYRGSNILSRYERIFIVDDDIVIDTSQINSLFDFSVDLKLEICSPSITKDSKVSHDVTVSQSDCLYRYTNFIEVNTPLMTRDAIQRLNKVYNSRLIGWGVDWLYIWACCDQNIPTTDTRKFAINDQITCVNPHDVKKQDKRELYKLPNSSDTQRRDMWWKYAKYVGCPSEWTTKTLKKIT